MKKSISIFMALAIALALVGPISAGSLTGYQMTASTFTIPGFTRATLVGAGTASQVSSTTLIATDLYDLDISVDNLDSGYGYQDVKLYNQIGSTTEATVLWEIVIASGNPVIGQGIYSKHFDPPLRVNNGLYLQKSHTNTAVKGSVSVE